MFAQEDEVGLSDVRDINKLLPQLSRNAGKMTLARLKYLLELDNFFIVDIRKDGHMVAMATLLVKKTSMGSSGIIEDVVVDKKYRGRGLGEEVVRSAVRLAEVLALDHIELTSRPSRKAANKLYRKIGFKKRNTNCYRMNL